ncbi:MAG: hypothetical protein NTY47_02865 [Candidatus Omnitrophica bacterium]|nr:hypothetical protein [Candidatus Omnitrophota bacterium]
MEKNNLKDIKLFGLGITIALSVISLRLFKSGNTLSPYLLASALALFILTIFHCSSLEPLYKTFKLIANLFGSAVTRIILFIIFYLIIVPLGVIMRVFGRDRLGLKNIQASSYWIERTEDPQKEDYEKQY